MPVHDWTRPRRGTFRYFHNAWIVHLTEALNGGGLPDGYYAIGERHTGFVVPDVVTFRTARAPDHDPYALPAGARCMIETPPEVHLTRRGVVESPVTAATRQLVIREESDGRVVALVEIVSPANKDRVSAVQDLAEKVVAVLGEGINLVLVDLLPPGPAAPLGMHGAVWSYYEPEAAYEPPAGKPLTVASYLADSPPTAFVEPLAVGDPLPGIPLFLDAGRYVSLPLEATYAKAYDGLPFPYRQVIEGRRPETAAQESPFQTPRRR